MRKKVVAEFKRLHQLLEDQEYMWMSDLVALERTIMDSKKSYEAKVHSEKSYVDNIHTEMEDRYWEDEKEFLQDFGKSLVRFDNRKIENPVAFPTELKTRIQKFCDRRIFLDNVVKTFNDEMAVILKGRGRKRFKRSLSEEQKGNRVEVILDQDTAHPHLWLSQDLKKMCYVKYIVPLLERPRGFKFSPCILGRQVFSSGRHYWNVKVCGLGREWALGIARESVARDDPPGPPDNGVWVVGKRRKDALYSRWLMAFALQEEDDDTVLILSQKPEKIRVCLDCSEGRVAFFNADTDEFIYSFSSPIISSERIRPFFWSFSESIEFLML
ncbi:zinc finger protein RFP-like [Sceloporus undulatus]|uniref:zinc finger protein RFP-like n=1 Tax=Sceloporus undulatus TaxID=8520 RepID=UPI001C4BDA19|nr:zinc finger protein RFP-like [Sceloporus undulatus]